MIDKQILFGNIELVCGILGFFSSLVTRLGINKSDEDRGIQMLIIHTGSTLLIIESLYYFYDKIKDFIPHWSIAILSFLIYFLGYMEVYLCRRYFKSILKQEGIIYDPKLYMIQNVLQLITVALLILNLFYRVFYYFDANIVYHRATFFLLSPGICFVVLMSMIVYLIKIRNEFTYPSIVQVYSVAMIVPFIIAIIGDLFLDFSLLNISMFISILIIVIYHAYIKNRAYEQQTKELADQRAKLLLSQMKPHFLYNCLNVIQALTTSNPEEAYEMIGHFSRFLRANMNSLEDNTMISFDKELDIVKDYVYLEQKRFKDKIKITYEIEDNDFLVLPLTVQPLVENAIKHGLRTKDNGGTVMVKSYLANQKHVIEVIDDGVGFDVNQPFGVGLKSVKYRVEYLYYGIIDVQSKIGEGTHITITLPKGVQQ